MIRKILFVCLLSLPLFAQIKWDSEYIFRLKKDEIGRIIFIEKGTEHEDFRYEFKFRWTLYDGQKVVLLSHYRKIPRQHVLYFKFRLDSFIQNLLHDKSKNSQKRTYLLLQMDEFDKKKNEILFLIFIKDKDKRFDIKYIKPKRRT